MSKLRTGARTPFFASDIILYQNLALSNVSPIENQPAVYSDSEEDMFIKNGFLIANATDTAGLAYVVTWEQFQIVRTRQNRALVTNAQVLALCVPIAVYLASGDWCMTPIVKVFATTNQTYPTTVAYVNVGTVR
jgi:hypothetical protein